MHPKILLPVMVYMHGGNFVRGNSSEISVGPGFLMNQQVVIVAINYRLGMMGFLSTGDKAASGNWGLKDMVMGLKWVQENILQFGGNPKKVTLFGEGSGGETVHLLTLVEKYSSEYYSPRYVRIVHDPNCSLDPPIQDRRYFRGIA